MKVTEITASFGRTIQFQQYEPVNVHVSLKAEVGIGDDNAASELNNIAMGIVNKQVDSLMVERARLDEERFEKEIPLLVAAIEGCDSREAKTKLWEETAPALRRVQVVMAAFKNNQITTK